METTHVPVTQRPVGGPAPASRTSGVARTHEGKESVSEGAEATLQQVKKAGEDIYHKACEACHNWRHYPKMLTAILLLSCFLLGAGTMAGVSKLSGRGYMMGHWDRTTADAHHALDVILDHARHPELYVSKGGVGVISRARNSIMDMVRGILPGKKYRAREGMEEMYERGTEQARDLTGRMYDKMSELGEDIGYGARRAGEKAKDTGYGMKQKLGEMAESVKQTFTGGRGARVVPHEEEGYLERMKRATGLGGYEGRRGAYGEERDELHQADEQLRHILREAEREL